MKRLVNAITCTRFVFALILALAVLLGQGTAAWLAAAAAGLSALEELVLVLRAWTPAPDVRGLLWNRKTTALRSAPWFCVPGNSAADGLRVAGDDELLVRRDDEHLDLGVGGGDHDVFAALAVGDRSIFTPR